MPRGGRPNDRGRRVVRSDASPERRLLPGGPPAREDSGGEGLRVGARARGGRVERGEVPAGAVTRHAATPHRTSASSEAMPITDDACTTPPQRKLLMDDPLLRSVIARLLGPTMPRFHRHPSDGVAMSSSASSSPSVFVGAFLPVAGVDVLIVLVHPSILGDVHEANLYVTAFGLRFRRTIILVAQDAARFPTFYGPVGLVQPLSRLPFDVIPWQRLCYRVAKPRPWRLPIPRDRPSQTSQLAGSTSRGGSSVDEDLSQTIIREPAAARCPPASESPRRTRALPPPIPARASAPGASRASITKDVKRGRATRVIEREP